MAQLGDDELITIFKRIPNEDDRRSFSQVSKHFLKLACSSLRRLHSAFPDLLFDILPESPNLDDFNCSKPLSNTHLKLLGQSCPKLRYLNLAFSSEQNSDSQADSVPDEFEFDKDGLLEVIIACRYLYGVSLRRRLLVRDVEVAIVVITCKPLEVLDLSGCVSVSDDSLKVIGETARCLRDLRLGGCYLITDLGLEYLANGRVKNSLEHLYLEECNRISDAGIIWLTQMVRLSNINLSKCGDNVTDFGVAALSVLYYIKILDLSWLINVTDMSLFHISRTCYNLEEIYLTGCKAVTGKGLRYFVDHDKLQELEFFSCHDFSWEDVEMLASECLTLRHLGLSRIMRKPIPDAIHNNFYMIENCWIKWE